MKVMEKIAITLLSILLIICLLSIGLWIYYKFFAPDTFTELTINLGEIEDTTGKRSVVEVVYYENADNTGIELLDVKLNGYSDTNANNIVSFGIQVIGGVENLNFTEDYTHVSKTTAFLGFIDIGIESLHYYTFISGDYGEYNHNAGNLCFYEESDNLNYANVNTAFDDLGYIRIEVEDKIFALQFGCERGLDHKLWEKHYQSSSLSEFVKDLGTQVKSCPVGQTSKTFGYKDMFKVFEVKDGKFEEISNQDEIYSYIYIDFKHYTTGAKSAQDSLFKQVQYNTNYVVKGASLLDEHFADKSITYLTYDDLYFKYDEQKQVHLLELTQNCYEYYKDKNKDLRVVIDKEYLAGLDIAYGGIVESGYITELNVTVEVVNSLSEVQNV